MRGEVTTEFTVLLVDDHPVVAAGVRLALRQRPNCTLLGAEARPETALDTLGEMKPDALILDLAFDGHVHLSFVSQCRRLVPDAAIVVFSSLPPRAYKPEALAAGADAFVSKSTDLESLLDTVTQLLEAPRRRMATMHEAEAVHALEVSYLGLEKGIYLTPREIDVARLLSRGTSIGEIARAIGVSVKTAASHRENLRKKLECQDSSELIARLAHIYSLGGDQ